MRRTATRPAARRLAVAAVTATTVAAQVYEYRGDDGVTVYSDRPPPDILAKAVLAPVVQTVGNASAASPAAEASDRDEDEERNAEAPAPGKSFLVSD